MNRFRARNRSDATLRSSPERVWDVLIDPELLPVLTPYLQSIDVGPVREDGTLWTWNLTRIPVLSATVMPTFTEVMTFDAPSRIGFAHDSSRKDERTGVDGYYKVTPSGTGAHVEIDLEIWCDLPLPKISRIAVETVMSGVVAAMGRRFATNMTHHLGE